MRWVAEFKLSLALLNSAWYDMLYHLNQHVPLGCHAYNFSAFNRFLMFMYGERHLKKAKGYNDWNTLSITTKMPLFESIYTGNRIFYSVCSFYDFSMFCNLNIEVVNFFISWCYLSLHELLPECCDSFLC